MPQLNFKAGFQGQTGNAPRRKTVQQNVLNQLFEGLKKKLDDLYLNPLEAYKSLNVDRSNGVDFVAFSAAMRRLNVMTPKQAEAGYVEALFEMCDRNGDGAIDYSEWCQHMRTDDRHNVLMVQREDPYRGERGGMSWHERTGWIRNRLGSLCE